MTPEWPKKRLFAKREVPDRIELKKKQDNITFISYSSDGCCEKRGIDDLRYRELEAQATREESITNTGFALVNLDIRDTISFRF